MVVGWSGRGNNWPSDEERFLDLLSWASMVREPAGAVTPKVDADQLTQQTTSQQNHEVALGFLFLWSEGSDCGACFPEFGFAHGSEFFGEFSFVVWSLTSLEDYAGFFSGDYEFVE
jgi:hypothetical protein